MFKNALEVCKKDEQLLFEGKKDDIELKKEDSKRVSKDTESKDNQKLIGKKRAKNVN